MRREPDPLLESLLRSEQRLGAARQELLSSMETSLGQRAVRFRMERIFPLAQGVDALCRNVEDSLQQWDAAGWSSAPERARRAAFLKSVPQRLTAIHAVLQQEMTDVDLLTGDHRKESRPWKELEHYIASLSPAQRGLLNEQLRLNVSGIAYYAEMLLNEQTTGCILGYETFSALVGQNATVLGRGEEIEINAGIGSFSRAAAPEFYFDGKRVEPGPSQQAVFRARVPVRPGSYRIPVEIRFKDQDGKTQTITKDVEYRVVACPTDSSHL